ncbi:hypothetical protein [Sphingomonas sp. LM7]|uniref:hypothetical protein n=1 Tax=Sphingomonas sp. LM7 TaxID=1938607 RepID=UPI000983985D|nr:hypothetical protein [Sphingomonas sp. LM7]AQR73155.1 hypothetical protein BXU08_05195 [Sphingomonas sp. LM7]
MTEEDEQLVLDAGGGEALLYDYFKHLTQLSLLSLGGVVALAGSARDERAMLIAALVVIGSSALISFSGAGEIVRTRFHGKPTAKYLDFYRVSAPILLSLGLGIFLYLFIRTLGPA